ncbi:MAG: flagellar hook-associated protein FlgK [Chloroflexota bacterium]
MRTSFLGYEIGRRSLQAHQLALAVTGHNIANASTNGYSRQVLRMQATSPYTMPTMSKVYGAGMIGTGVQVTDIRAVRDYFLDAQVRNETANIGYWEAQQDILSEVEVIFAEPQEVGLRSVIDQFWSAWEKVAANPSQTQYRQTLVQRGQELSDTFRTVFNQLRDLRQNLRETIASKTVEANALLRQIADLNRQIVRVTGAGDNPNDLMDERTRLTEQLARLVNVETHVESNGSMNVIVNGHAAVSGFAYDQLVTDDTTLDTGPFVPRWQNTGDQLNLAGGGIGQSIGSGELGAYVDANNRLVKGYQDDVEALAQSIVLGVNAQHAVGYGLGGETGLDFFHEATAVETYFAASIRVEDAIINNPSLIAAADAPPIPPETEPPPGAGANAREIARLVQSGITVGGATIDDFFRGLIGGLGVASQAAERQAENQKLLLSQIENQRTAAVGVSTDEEMINLIKFQQGYNAAARLITTFDEMVDTIINRMGLVGR